MRLLGALPADVMGIVVDMTGISEEAIRGERRGSDRICAARHLLIWAAHTHGGSLVELASYLNRHQTSIQSSLRRVEGDPSLKALAMEVAEAVREKYGCPSSFQQSIRSGVEA